MAKKLTPQQELLAKAARATKSTKKQQPAGQKAVQETIAKKKKDKTSTYNIRLAKQDSDIVDLISDALREQGIKRPPASDSFRVALRAISSSPNLLKKALQLLEEE